MNKFIPLDRKSQDKKDFFSRILLYISHLPKYKRRVLFQILEWSMRNHWVHPTQTTLAHLGGCTRKTMNLWMKELQQVGLLHKTTRHMKTCIYRIDEIFYEQEMKDTLFSLYGWKLSACAFVFFNATLLLSNSFQSEYVPEINTQNYIYNLLSKLSLERVINAQVRARESQAPPNKHAAFRKKVKNMLPFDDDEIKALSIYPKATRDYAHRRLTKEIASGRAITNHYAYFVGICKTHVVTQNSTAKAVQAPKREVQRPTPSLRSSKSIEYAQPSYDTLKSLYDLRLRVFNKGLQWFALDHDDLEKIANGFKTGTKLSAFDCAPRPPVAPADPP